MTSLIYYKVETEKSYNSIIQVPKLVQLMKERNTKAVGIADVQSMYSVMDLNSETTKNGIKPIIAMQCQVAGKTKEESLFVTFVAKDYVGYLEIVRILNTINGKEKIENAKKKGNSSGKKHLDIAELPQLTNVIATISLYPYMKEDRVVFIQGLINNVVKKVGQENAWVELEPAFTSADKNIQHKTAAYAEDKKMKIIAAPSVHYYGKQKNGIYKKATEKLVGLKKKKNVLKNGLGHGCFLTEEEEKKAFAEFPQAVQQTQVLSELCFVQFPFKGKGGYENKLPDYQVPKDFVIPLKFTSMFKVSDKFVMPSDEEEVRRIAYLCDKAWKNFMEKYKNNPDKKEVGLRLKDELGTVISLDLTNYFLIVQDFMQYAKKKRIATGPGRGSAVGSVLTFCLDIIKIDPIEYNLLFERFLNEVRGETSDPADIDIDVSKRNRYKLFRYAREKYGIYQVAKIVTFNPYGAKKSLEYIGKAYDMPEKMIKKLKEPISEKEGRIEEVLAQKVLVEEVTKVFPQCLEVLEIAKIIQEMPESRGNHAAGMVLSKNDFRTELPLDFNYDKELGEMIPIIQFTKDSKHLEKMGYVKIDFLYLRTLDVIEDTKEMVMKRKGIDLTDIPLEDDEVNQLFQSGNLIGIFQLDSKKMRETAVATKPKTFRDIINLIALYRPGAMDEIDNYVENKKENNRHIYDVDGAPIQGVQELEEILYRTYGIIVYQEQIMMIARVWSGYGLAEADVLRRAISGKNREVMEKERVLFVENAKKLNRDEVTSNKIYDLIVKFAEFGFNESHSVAYALVAYICAYLKAKYPVEFMSALITSKMDDTPKAAEYVVEAKRMGIEVLKPSINHSRELFVPVDDEILFGLPMIKDVGVNPILRLVEERNKRQFLNFTDFLNRIHSSEVNVKVIKALISVGAFDEFGNQNQLMKLLEAKTEPMKLPTKQMLFTDVLDTSYDFIEQLPDEADVPLNRRIELQKEYACMVLEKSPMDGHAFVYRRLLQRINKTKKMFGGVIVDKVVIKTKKGEDMAFVKIRTEKGEEKVTVFPAIYEKYKEQLDLFSFVLFLVKKDEARDQFILQQLEKVNGIRMIVQYPLEVAQLNKEEQRKWMDEFEGVLNKHNGTEELIVSYQNRQKKYRVDIKDRLVKDLAKLVKSDMFTVEKVR